MGILEDLRWMGLDWDEGPDLSGPFSPYLQSQRMNFYHQAMEVLAKGGWLFTCTCSRKDVREAASAPHGGGEAVYPGRCRHHLLRRWDGSTPPGTSVRLRVPGGRISWEDLVHGAQQEDPAVEAGDFVVWRGDGVPAYQLAVVVDDAAMEVGEVWRGDDLLGSTSRQILLYRALGHPIPTFGHVPLVLGPDGQRLAKRHGAVSLAELRALGVNPKELVGRLARSLGLSHPAGNPTPQEVLPFWNRPSLHRTAVAMNPLSFLPADLRILPAD